LPAIALELGLLATGGQRLQNIAALRMLDKHRQINVLRFQIAAKVEPVDVPAWAVVATSAMASRNGFIGRSPLLVRKRT